MCTDKSVGTKSSIPVRLVGVRGSLGSNEEVPYPAYSQKPTTFQMAAKNYSEELRDQRIKLDQEINDQQSNLLVVQGRDRDVGGLTRQS